jgi:hypothetical protein
MQEYLASPFLFVLGILVLTVAVPVITHHWFRVRRLEMETALKQDMLQRGMTAEEIKMVMEASSTSGGRCGKVSTHGGRFVMK